MGCIKIFGTENPDLATFDHKDQDPACSNTFLIKSKAFVQNDRISGLFYDSVSDRKSNSVPGQISDQIFGRIPDIEYMDKFAVGYSLSVLRYPVGRISDWNLNLKSGRIHYWSYCEASGPCI